MERDPAIRGNNPERQIVLIEEAQLLDPLEPQYEELWNQLIKSEDITKEGGVGYLQAMGAVWNNQDLPQAFRDRALLVLFGTAETRQTIGAPTTDTRHPALDLQLPGMGDHVYRNNNSLATYRYTGLSLAEGAEFLQRVFDHRQATGTELIGVHHLIPWWAELVKADLLSREQVQENLINIDVTKYTYDVRSYVLREVLDEGGVRIGEDNEGYAITATYGEVFQDWAYINLKRLIFNADPNTEDGAKELKSCLNTLSWALTKHPQRAKRMILDEVIRYVGWDNITSPMCINGFGEALFLYKMDNRELRQSLLLHMSQQPEWPSQFAFNYRSHRMLSQQTIKSLLEDETDEQMLEILRTAGAFLDEQEVALFAQQDAEIQERRQKEEAYRQANPPIDRQAIKDSFTGLLGQVVEQLED